MPVVTYRAARRFGALKSLTFMPSASNGRSPCDNSAHRCSGASPAWRKGPVNHCVGALNGARVFALATGCSYDPPAHAGGDARRAPSGHAGITTQCDAWPRAATRHVHCGRHSRHRASSDSHADLTQCGRGFFAGMREMRRAVAASATELVTRGTAQLCHHRDSFD
jgi:hypothetical protein